jgi:PAS domain S-box-containing protein
MSDTPEKMTSGAHPTLGGHSADREQVDRDMFYVAVSATRMPMLVTDAHHPDNPILFANKAFLSLTGYSKEEVEGRNPRFLQGPETDPAAVKKVGEAIREGREITVDILNYRKNGSTFWNGLYVSPVHDGDGNLVYWFGSQLDVTRRRDAEDTIRQAQKMESLGQLTGGIAHDFNNLLQVILGYMDRLKSRLVDSDDAAVHRAIKQVIDAGERGAVLTQQLLAFARKQRLEGRPFNLNELVMQMSSMVERTLGANITLEHKLAPDLWNARVDPVQAEMAFLNVVINARDAMPAGGKLLIETANRTIKTAEQVAALRDLTPGDYVLLAVTDTGHGIPAHVLPHVTEPFFTTKDKGKGTGLGLSMVHGFMKQTGGALHLHSKKDQGTSVCLYFPATEHPDLRSTDESAQELRHQGSETVLVVDDQPEVRELAETTLADYGYNVVGAASGHEALNVLQHRHIDLLFSDVLMPGGMDGIVLAHEARRLYPDLKILLTTGFTELPPGIAELDFQVLGKPYRRDELARKVRVVLDAGDAATPEEAT